MATHCLKRSFMRGKIKIFAPTSMRMYKNNVCLQYPDSSYRDITKSNDTIVGFDELMKKMQTHVGGKRSWPTAPENVDKSSATVLSQDELVTRSMADSLQEYIVPLGRNLQIRDEYLNIFGHVRVGRLLEDMDAFAVWIGFKYFKGPTERPMFNLVTACVDSIDLSACRALANQDIKLNGFVSWAGKTSMEVTIFLEQQGVTGEWKKLSKAVFILAARSLKDDSATFINKMTPQNEEESMYFLRGKENRRVRKSRLRESLFQNPPTKDERYIIHDIFLKTLDSKIASFQSRVKPPNTIWMEDTLLKNLIICHPQSRNMYNKIFGGFIMREAFELSWASASLHMKSRPIVTGMEDIVFKKPVEIGSLLCFSSIIIYTSDQYLQTRVVAEVVDPITGIKETTNTFHFHFASEISLPQVIPKTYGEYILYLDGRRHCPAHLRND